MSVESGRGISSTRGGSKPSQGLQQTTAAILVLRDVTAFSAAAAELRRPACLFALACSGELNLRASTDPHRAETDELVSFQGCL